MQHPQVGPQLLDCVQSLCLGIYQGACEQDYTSGWMVPMGPKEQRAKAHMLLSN